MIIKLKQSAFTLIEIIVVLMVIALTVGIVGISTNSLQARNELQPFVDTLYQKLTNIEPQAILKQREIGLSIYSNKIEILAYNANSTEWEYKQTISVPNSISIKYEILEKDLFDVNLAKTSEAKKLKTYPEIIFTSNGHVTPFTFTITHPAENNYYIISSQYSGEFSLQTIPNSIANSKT